MNRNKSVEASESIIPFLVSSRRLYRTFRYYGSVAIESLESTPCHGLLAGFVVAIKTKQRL